MSDKDDKDPSDAAADQPTGVQTSGAGGKPGGGADTPAGNRTPSSRKRGKGNAAARETAIDKQAEASHSAARRTDAEQPVPSESPTADDAAGTSAPAGLANPSATPYVAAQPEPKSETRTSAESAATPAAKASRDTAGGKATGGGSGGSGSGGAQPPRRKRRWLRVILWLLVLAGLAAALLVGGRELQRELQTRDQQATESANRVQNLQQALSESQQRLQELAGQLEELRQSQSRLDQAQTQQAEQVPQNLGERLNDVEQSLAHQRSRLRALSTTTREDWLLAEAEYLLKLAYQRMLIERSTEPAVALLQEVNVILQGLDDPKLLPLRQAVTRDLTELKLAADVDLEGLYLRLSALADNIGQLPTMPKRGLPRPQAPASGEADEAQQALPWWQEAWATLQNMFDNIGSYVRIRDHQEQPSALLPPESAAYLQQNLRLMLERAQLAAMREEPNLYQQTLQTAIDWARRFYPESRQLDRFVSELQELREVDVQPELPDITGSLTMVSEYIDRLHRLDDGDGQGSASQRGGGR